MKVNSTSLLVTIPSLPTVPPDDQWSSNQTYDIVYYRSDTPTKKTVSINGELPISKNITGLEKYTDYTVYIHYYGKIQSTIENNIISGTIQQKTDEDGEYEVQIF